MEGMGNHIFIFSIECTDGCVMKVCVCGLARSFWLHFSSFFLFLVRGSAKVCPSVGGGR